MLCAEFPTSLIKLWTVQGCSNVWTCRSHICVHWRVVHWVLVGVEAARCIHSRRTHTRHLKLIETSTSVSTWSQHREGWSSPWLPLRITPKLQLHLNALRTFRWPNLPRHHNTDALPHGANWFAMQFDTYLSQVSLGQGVPMQWCLVDKQEEMVSRVVISWQVCNLVVMIFQMRLVALVWQVLIGPVLAFTGIKASCIGFSSIVANSM